MKDTKLSELRPVIAGAISIAGLVSATILAMQQVSDAHVVAAFGVATSFGLYALGMQSEVRR